MDLAKGIHGDVDLKEETNNRWNSMKFGEVDNVTERTRLDPSRAFHAIYVGEKIRLASWAMSQQIPGVWTHELDFR